MRVTLYTANCKGNKKNCIYPNRCVIEDEVDFMAAVGYDHVCAWFDKSYRSTDNFRTSDVDVMDWDNDHSDNPDDWIYPENYEKLFPDFSYIVVPSRNNMKVKDGKSARPRHHVYFPHDPVDTAEACAALKTAIYQKSPFFDSNALDAARFIYGFACEEIVWHEGEITIDCLLKPSMSAIPQGQRNSTMSRFAGRVVKRYGATDHAYNIFMEEAAKCDPPLEDEELQLIWGSASKFAARVQSQEDYVAPDDYNDDFAHESFKPSDYSDIGQAKSRWCNGGVFGFTAAGCIGRGEEFMDGHDGYWYGFSNATNSTGSATMLWTKILKSDYTVTEGQWTLSNAKLMSVGDRDGSSSYPERNIRCCVRNGYLYVPANDKKGIYKINIANSSDVTLIDFGFTSKWKPLCDAGSCEVYMILIGDIILAGDFQVLVNDTIVNTLGSARLNDSATPLFQYREFLVGW